MKTDLNKLQNNYFEAMVSNHDSANKAIMKTQNWLLILALGELAFLGKSIEDQSNISLFLKISFAVLLFSFVLFIIGSVLQYKHLLKNSRRYHELSSRTIQFIKSINKFEIEEIPESLRDNKNKISSSKWANGFLFSSFILILGETLSLIIKILFF